MWSSYKPHQHDQKKPSTPVLHIKPHILLDYFPVTVQAGKRPKDNAQRHPKTRLAPKSHCTFSAGRPQLPKYHGALCHPLRTKAQPITQHPVLSTPPAQNTFAEPAREIRLRTLSSSSTGTSWSRSSRTASTFPAPAAQCRAVRSVWKRRKEGGTADVCTMRVCPPSSLKTQLCHPGSQNSPRYTGFSLATALSLLALLSGSDLC